MIFIKGETYRHDSTLDVDIYVRKVFSSDADSTKLKVYYINRHYGIIHDEDDITIKSNEYDKWNKIS